MSPDSNGYVVQARLIAEAGRMSFSTESPVHYVGMHWLETTDGVFHSSYPASPPSIFAATWKTRRAPGARVVTPLLASATLMPVFFLARRFTCGRTALLAAAVARGPQGARRGDRPLLDRRERAAECGDAYDFARVGHLGGRGTQISGRSFIVAAAAKILGSAHELARLLGSVLPAGGRGSVRAGMLSGWERGPDDRRGGRVAGGAGNVDAKWRRRNRGRCA